jgi:hypothetical protein
MLGINLKHSLATVAVAAGVLVAAGSANAATDRSGLVAYNGHAGLGASAYQHHQTDYDFALGAGVTDGTSNTLAFSIDVGTSENLA